MREGIKDRRKDKGIKERGLSVCSMTEVPCMKVVVLKLLSICQLIKIIVTKI